MQKLTGTVKWFSPDKGFGFIKDGDVDYFVHHSQIEMSGYRKLEEGQVVRFVASQRDKGLCAESVEVVP